MEKLDFDTAKLRCKEKNSTIFQANNLDEWTEVIKMTPYSWTWTGIVQEDSDKTSIKQKKICPFFYRNWLVKPFSPLANGWSKSSTCVAYNNVGRVALNYVHFYPCTNKYHSICERRIGLHV
ncbi:hypothetical protein OESDEN_25211 [Oesophagostomum dentatum]|uniref:C-type lectin domain-containing protein n=1 Tax=Oesophagostomum dentatum TaxID=61180 RepID=A0A0B1RQ64_OESDE|nr:hypothetical protein OESDEN_25211 [Oesophagostomum dentatum]